MSMPAGEGGQGTATGGQGSTGNADQGNVTSGSTTATDPGAQSGANDTVSRADFETLRRQLQAADKNRNDAEARLKALQDAQLSEEEKRKQDLEAAQKALTEREKAIQDLQIQNAFLTDNTYDWHDPRAALRLADLSGVEIDAKGTVTGLKEALKAVADANPWMLKAKSEGEAGGNGTNSNGSGQGNNTNQPSGVTGVSGRPGQQPSGDSRAALEAKFPALRGRTSTT